ARFRRDFPTFGRRGTRLPSDEMRKRLLAVVLALTLAAVAVFAVAAPTHAASSAFGGNVCRLVTAKQIAAFPGVSTTCKNAQPMPALGATQYVGNWASRTPTSSNLQVTVARYSDSQALQLARRNLNQGLSGTP